MMPAVIVKLLATLAILCQLAPLGGGVPSSVSSADTFPQGKAEWEPEAADVTALAKTLYGECRGCSELQQRAVAWTIFNRVDSSEFPNSLLDVVNQPYQFAGYAESFPVTAELEALARDCLEDWHFERERVLEPDFLYFFGNGRINIFSTEYGGKGERWAEE